MVRLRRRAARNGHSVEDEARDILRSVLSQDAGGTVNLADAIRQRFATLGGVDLPEMPREAIREPPGFDDDTGDPGG
ncbi:plasmid stabilization protein [Mycobacterium sp. KBS0706]|nr:plasmid stabilization protein [Mycobacterium sp. KBS0706]TSD86954.1 plasmid stabilization protein [Mycobacterium sp. KBS0706]